MAVSCMYCEQLPIDGDVTEYISQNIDRIAEKADYLKIVFALHQKLVATISIVNALNRWHRWIWSRFFRCIHKQIDA